MLSRLGFNVLARIVTPPRNPFEFFKGVYKKMLEFRKEAEEASKTVERLSKGDAWRDLPVPWQYDQPYYLLKSVATKNHDYGDFDSEFEYMFKVWSGEYESDAQSNISNTIKLIDRLLEFITSKDGWSSIKRNLDAIKETTDDEVKDFQQEMEYYDKSNPDDRPYFEVMDFVPGLMDLNERFVEYMQSLEDPLNALKHAHLSALEKYYNNKPNTPYRPESGETETLYHATVNADDLAANGFRSNVPEGGVGLGGSLTIDGDMAKSGISFTTSREEAEDIADALKDVASIGRGDLTLEELKKEAEEDGVLDKIMSSIGTEVREDDLASIFEFYKYYIALSPTRYNPLFFGVGNLPAKLKDLDPGSIGVVEAEVALDAGPYEYLPAMYEVRVYPEAVKSVRRVS